LLFLLPDYAITRFAKFAPDFWAWKSMEVRLQSEKPIIENLLNPMLEHERVVPVPPERFEFLYQFLEQYRQPSLTRADLLNQLGNAYISHVRYPEAEPVFKEALKLYQSLHNSLGEAQALNDLAELYYSQGRYTEVEPLWLRSLQIREQQLGADHPHTAQGLNNLAALYKSQGRYTEAKSLYQRALVIWQAKLGTDHPHTQIVIESLASLQAQVASGFDPELLQTVFEALAKKSQALDIDPEILH